MLYEESDPLLGRPNRYRLTLTKRDADFFREYIQDEGGIINLKDLHSTALPDSRKNIKDNALLFLKRLENISDCQRVRLAQFITNRCFLVMVSTPDLDSAYRIFSVLNDRVTKTIRELLLDFSSITIEHVLPQNPDSGSEWETLFPNQQQRQKYLHRLGNLVLLSRRKNSEAQNYKFEVKKQKYFTTRNGVSPFALTTQVLKEQEWTPGVIERRHKELIDKLKKVWRLQ